MASRRAPARGNGRPEGRPHSRLSQLWQLPLLLLSLGIFGYAAYLFIDPRPGLTIVEKIDAAQHLLRHDRPEAGIEQLNKILDSEKLSRENESRVHLMLAQAIEAAQKLRGIDLPANHERIIEQSGLALAEGMKPDADLYRRLGESCEFLGKTTEALDSYRRAMALDPTRALHLQRKVIDLQLALDDPGPAQASLDEYLKDPKLADSERAWALGHKAQLLINHDSIPEARTLLGEVLRLDPDSISQGTAHYRLGYCAWKLGDLPEAERLLRLSRDQLHVGHPLDADAAWLLGKVREQQKDPREAMSFYDVVLVSHPESRPAPLARLGRGVCRIAAGDDEAGLTDLHDLVDEIGSKKSRERYKADAIVGLRDAAATLSSRGNYQGALEVMAYEQTLDPEPAAPFYARLGAIYEKRAAQVEQTIADAADPAEKLRREQHSRELLSHAGDASIAYSRALTLADDKGHGEALWHGVELYDRAGNMQQAIAALELFAAEHPEDGQAPDALLRLGRAYQAAGQFDKAIAAFQRNQFRYPQSLAASKSGVPLAQAYIARGPENYSKAEKVLMAVVENNPMITPEAEEFRQALFEMAQLYYRTGRYEEAVSRLEETTQRYPQDERKGRLLFLMADSYRKSASLLEVKLASASSADGAGSAAAQAEAAAAKRERLLKANKLFDDVIATYGAEVPAQEIDRIYLKMSHFYRADCLYDLGRYDDAIKLYDAAALHYQDDPAALAAYVQIVNAFCALGKMDEAKAANERAKWLLRRMPADAFEDGKFAMPKEYWDQWLKWTSNSGIWAKPTARP